VTAITNAERDDLPCLLVHGDPDPLACWPAVLRNSTSHPLPPPDAP
jgi:hypothetical protein